MEVEDYGGTMSSVEVNHNGSNSGAQQSSSLSSKKRLDFSSTIERIVSTLEQRGDNHNPHHGPLNDSEISKLSMLCSQQTEHLRSINNHNKAKENYGSGTQSHILNDDLGFADVDADMMGELVEYLEKHVALASGIDLIQSSYRMIQTLKASSDGKQKKGQRDIDEWIQNYGSVELMGTLSMGLEAATILLFIMISPGVDRRVVNEDAIVASMVLMRNNVIKNILPAINDCGHDVGAAAVAAAAKSKASLQSSPPNKKRRRGSSANNGVDASVIRDMNKCYVRLVHPTVGRTVLLMERLDELIQRVPLDDQHLITCIGGSLATLELDPGTDLAIKIAHQLHVATVGVITSVFRVYPRLRSNVVEELFPLMLKMPTTKRSMRTFPLQGSAILYPRRVRELSNSLLAGPSTSGTSAGTINVVTNGHRPTHMAIQPMSALVLSLVQACVIHPTYVNADNGNDNDEQTDDDSRPDGNRVNQSPSRLGSGLGGCQGTSDLFVRHLLMRCSKRGEDGGASEFRPILANLVDDLLLVLLVPEYPSAEMILLSIVNNISRDLLSISKGRNSKQETTETTYLNTIFDALGRICAAEARILTWNRDHPVMRTEDRPAVGGRRNSGPRRISCYCKEVEFGTKFMVNCDRCNVFMFGDCVGISKENVPEKWLCDGCVLVRVGEFEVDRNKNLGELGCPLDSIDAPYCMRRLLLDYLAIESEKSIQVGIRDSYGYHLGRWLDSINTGSSRSGEQTDVTKSTALLSSLLEFWDHKEMHSIHHWNDNSKSLSGMLQCLSDEGRSRIVVDLICTLSSLLVSFRSQVRFIVELLGSDATSIRKLSLKAIEKIADADPKLMLYPFIRNAVTKRFSDESISVRDAAVSLVGSYVVNTPEVANAFHASFVMGLHDSGVSVRKRSVNVFHDILCTNPNYKERAEACSIMLRLAADPKEDDTVRDLIHELFSKIWLENGDETLDQELTPVSSRKGDEVPSPVSKVSNIEVASPASTNTPASERLSLLTETPNIWSTATKSLRSTAKKMRSRQLQIRCEVAAEQMVEVVKAANTGEDLTLLFRELISDIPDSDKTKRSSARKKRQGLAKVQCALLVDSLFEMLLAVEEDQSVPAVGKGADFVAIFRTIRVFTDVSPHDVIRHLDTLLPYVKTDNGLSVDHEAEIACSLCGVLSRIVPELERQDFVRLGDTSLSDDLVGITKKWGRAASSSAVQTLCLLADHKYSRHAGVFSDRLLQLARVFYTHLVKHQDSDSYTAKKKSRENVMRALSVTGSICRFYESSSFDAVEIEDDDEDDDGDHLEDKSKNESQELSLLNIAPLCEKIFTSYLAKNDTLTKCTALRALAGVFMSNPREMLRMDQSGLISDVMALTAPESLQLEALRCWRDILLAEEARVESGEAKAKMDAKENITVSKKISGDQDADATLFGGILTNHAHRLFEMTRYRDILIRSAALDLVGLLLRQGQVNPNEATPHLLALQGDLDENVRSRALKLLMLEGEKRPDMLRQRLRAGVKQAYMFQHTVYPDLDEVSALITVNKDGIEQKECVFGSVFKECIAKIKKQRRSLYRNLLAVFDPENLKIGEANSNKTIYKGQKSKTDPTSELDLSLLSYTSQVLAYLPYGVASDPLYIIHHIGSILALNGADLLERFAAFLRPCGLSTSDELDEVNVEEDYLEIAAKSGIPHQAKEAALALEPSFDVTKFSRLCVEAGCLILLLRIKAFLRVAYNLSESRCLSFDPDAKELAEKPISKSPTLSSFNSKLPMQDITGKRGNELLDCMILQYAEFRKVMRLEVIDAAVAEASEGDGEMDEHAPARKPKKRRASSLTQKAPSPDHS